MSMINPKMFKYINIIKNVINKAKLLDRKKIIALGVFGVFSLIVMLLMGIIYLKWCNKNISNEKIKTELIESKEINKLQTETINLQQKINDIKETDNISTTNDLNKHRLEQEKIEEDLIKNKLNQKNLKTIVKDTNKIDTLSNSNINSLWSSYCTSDKNQHKCKE
jgi:uncharacterized membrane protein YhiD involved in acid resistance